MNGKESWLVVGTFILSRLLFFFWLTHFSTIYQDPDYNGREPSIQQDGLWVEDVAKIRRGLPPTAWEDAGMPYLMASLHALGIPAKQTFFWSSLLLCVCAAVPLYFLSRLAPFPIMMTLALYPPGVYYSFFNMQRILPVYLFLTFLVMLLWAEKLFATINPRRIALFVLIGLFATFMVAARKSNNVIVMAGLLAIGLRLFKDRARYRHFLVFGLIVAGMFSAGWYMTRGTQHLTWHSLYHGLADFDNKYGFENNDDFSKNAVLAARPDVDPQQAYGHPAYDLTLKRLYFEAVRNDPFWYARILFLRSVKLALVPFHGSWVVPLSKERPRTTLYRAAKISTALLDLSLVLLGAYALARKIHEKRRALREILPYFVLVSSVLYIYVFIGTGNRTVYIAGAYFYLFFALDYLRRVLHERKIQVA